RRIAGERHHPPAQIGTEIRFNLIGVGLQARIDLTAIPAGGAPTGLMRLQHHDVDTLFGEVQRRRQSREARADDRDRHRPIARQRRRFRCRFRGFGIEAARQCHGVFSTSLVSMLPWLEMPEGTIMAPNAKRVFYVKYLPSAVYPTVLAQRPDVQLDKLENDSPDDLARPTLTQGHVYQIGASRQIIAPHFQVNAALLARTPNLIAASSNGAGYDTIDVDACTDAGVAVVNQSGGNKEAVAEHALA